MMIILMIRTENKGWLCYCHMLLVSKKQKMEHATLKIRVGQKYTGSVSDKGHIWLMMLRLCILLIVLRMKETVVVDRFRET